MKEGNTTDFIHLAQLHSEETAAQRGATQATLHRFPSAELITGTSPELIHTSRAPGLPAPRRCLRLLSYLREEI